MHPLIIKDLTPDDIPALAEIELYSEHARWSRQNFESEIYGPGRSYSRIKTAHLRCEDSPPAGFICFRLIFEELYILKIAVRPDSRRMGIGSALVRDSIRAGMEAGASRAVLDVDAANTAALKLYKKLGFHPPETIPSGRYETLNLVRPI